MNEFVTVRFEACAAFASDDSALGPCGHCGWLAEDHDAGAQVHRLPHRARTPRREPQRKAS